MHDLKDIHYEIMTDLANGEDSRDYDQRFFRPLKRLGLVEPVKGQEGEDRPKYKLTSEGRKALKSQDAE